jgi:hypothetical protein
MGHMILSEQLTIGVEDSAIAERLSRRNSDEIFNIIMESSLDVASFSYEKSRDDPKPKVLVLGRWQHPKSGNQLVCGVNLHYLTKEQVEALKQIMPQIMLKDSLKAKYWEGMSLAPDIFKTSYRTYDERYIKNVNNSEFDIPDATTGPEQQDIEPLAKPSSPEMPERGASSPPPPDIDGESDLDAQPIGDTGLGDDLDLGTSNGPMPGVDDRIPQAPQEPAPTPAPAPTQVAPAATPKEPKATEDQSSDSAPKEDEKAKEEPEVPKKARSILSKAKDVIKKLSNLVTGKLSRNKAKKSEGAGTSSGSGAAKKKEDLTTADMADYIDKGTHHLGSNQKKEIKHLRDIDNEHEIIDVPGGSDITKVADLVQPAEDEVGDGIIDKLPKENFESTLDAILEQFNPNPRGWWETKQQYIDLHAPSKFFLYDAKVGDTVLECATGTNCFLIYHAPTKRTVIDLTETPFEILEEAGWRMADCVCLTVGDGGITTINESRNPIVEKVRNSNAVKLLVEVAKSLN